MSEEIKVTPGTGIWAPAEIIESERAHHAMTAGCLRTDLEYAQAEIARLREALSELADLMDGVISGEYKPDSFTTQPARAALEASHDS